MIKKLKYIYNNSEVNITSSGSLKLSDIIKRSLSRKGYDINKFIEENNKNLEKCRICKTHYPPVFIECHEENGLIIVDGFTKLKDRVYCYGLNKECPGIKMNSNSIEFISKTLLISNEEALKYIKSNNKSSFYKENWDNLDDYKKSQSRDVNFFKEKYKENWQNSYNNYIDKIKKSNSIERYISEYGYEEGVKIYKDISKKKNSMSFNFFLRKNNNNYKKTKFEYYERLKSVSNNLESFIKRYGEEDGFKKYNIFISKKSESMLNYFKKLTTEEKREKHGITPDKIGQKKYNEWIEKIMVPITKASKESEILFRNVLSTLNIKLDDDIHIGIDDKREYFIKDGNKIFFYDFVIKSMKIIIEYNGIVWHPKFENIDTFKPIGNKQSAIELYNRQQNKIKLAESKGFKVLEVWSDDPDNLKKCLNFIIENKNKNE
jgi:very-short-patch-repair endonuclease